MVGLIKIKKRFSPGLSGRDMIHTRARAYYIVALKGLYNYKGTFRAMQHIDCQHVRLDSNSLRGRSGVSLLLFIALVISDVSSIPVFLRGYVEGC